MCLAEGVIVSCPAPPRLRPAEPLLVFGALLAVLLGLSKGLGLTWDESTYFIFSDTVAAWFRSGPDFSAEAVRRAWAYDPFFNPHPPFFKVLDAMGSALTSGWLVFPLSYRFAHLAFAAGCLSLIYSLIRAKASRVEALAALAFAILAPRALGDLLLASTDGPVMIAWLTAVVLAWRIGEAPEEQPPHRLRGLLIVICAVAGAAKFTGLLIPLPVAVYFIARRRWSDVLVVAGGALAALVLVIASSPDKWAHPLGGVIQYLSYPFMRTGIPIPTTYLGTFHSFRLPWHYFTVMSAVTFPVEIWLCLPGLLFAPPRFRSLAQSLTFSVLFWLIVVHLPNTPRHDGVRQFVSVYPLIALLGFIGLTGYRRRLVEEYPRMLVASKAMFLAVPLALVGTVWRSHPHELSYYNPVIGGLRGAEALGMEITYYFDALSDDTLRAMDSHILPGQTLGMSPLWARLLESYRDHGRLRMDFKVVDYREPSDWLLLYRRRHMVDDEAYIRVAAVHEVTYDGVSLLKLVKRGGAAPAR